MTASRSATVVPTPAPAPARRSPAEKKAPAKAPANQANQKPATTLGQKKPKKGEAIPLEQRKIFVLDTSVILYDHDAIRNFQEHDVVIPISVLEELDRFKKGNDTLNFQAREFIRYLDKMAGGNSLQEWNNINGPTRGKFKVEMNEVSIPNAEEVFNERKADHRILNAAINSVSQNPGREVVMVTKDVNLRLKAKALKLRAEDYETGKVKDLGSLYKGMTELFDAPQEGMSAIYKDGNAPAKSIFGRSRMQHLANSYFILKSSTGTSGLAYYNEGENRLERVERNTNYGIKPRNAEQAFALHALNNPNVLLVSLQGVAGTGKTLLALAAALEQRSRFRQIFLARPIVPLSNKDIGYLPGDIKSKLNPYMEPLYDNLKFIQNQFGEREKEAQKISELLENEKLVIQPLAYIRGRSLSNIYFIVDEAQNLTPHEVKTIISRAGENTKIVFTGDVNQIDHPYLDSHSNGLSYLIDRMKGQALYAHITLEKGERSALANLANELL